jgi:hypothetical protein
MTVLLMMAGKWWTVAVMNFLLGLVVGACALWFGGCRAPEPELPCEHVAELRTAEHFPFCVPGCPALLVGDVHQVRLPSRWTAHARRRLHAHGCRSCRWGAECEKARGLRIREAMGYGR